MKILPFAKRNAEPEPAEDRNYSDIITQALVDAASDNLTDAYVSALEIASGQLSRAFTAAGVEGAGAAAFDPWVMAQIGRQLVEQGEAVWYRVGMTLRRADNYQYRPSGAYELSFPEGPRIEPASRVFHARWNIDTGSQRGLAPLGAARTLRVLMQRLEATLATEGNAAVGYLLPVPTDGDAANISQLKEDLAGLQGRIAVVETTRGGWGDGRSGAPQRDFALARLGPSYPEGNVRMFVAARESVLAACGYPVQLAQDSDGTAQREAWRRYLHGTVSPMGRIVTAAAARVGLAITLDWDNLFASDVQGRARAFQSLVNGGMSLEAAAAASGILTPQED